MRVSPPAPPGTWRTSGAAIAPQLTDSMDLLVRRVRRAIRQHHLIDPGDRLAVAVSGGADSVALLLLLAELSNGVSSSVPFVLAGAIHVHHGLRGEEADADELFVRTFAERLPTPLEICRVDVRAAMAVTGRSLEATARDLRYAALAAAAARLGATRVATGHTADDQAETVLLRLLRGTSTRGVSAVRGRRGLYTRPLLDIRRAELRAWLAAHGQDFREDRSNADESLTRNRLRHHLLPVLEADWPGGVAALARYAEIAVDDEQFLSAEAQRIADDATRLDGDGVQVDMEALRHVHPAIARRVIRNAIEEAGCTPSFRAVEAVRRMMSGSGSPVSLPGLRAARSGHVVTLAPSIRPEQVPSFTYELPLPGLVQLRETQAAIQASFFRGATIPVGSHPDRAVLQEGALNLPLTVRSRRAGDRLRPLGAPGTRKLQDVLVDRKVPRAQRDTVPLIVDAQGRIVWVAGIAIAHEYRVTSPEAGMVILEMKKGNQ